MLVALKKIPFIRRIRKTRQFARLRRRFPIKKIGFVDDQDVIAREKALPVHIDWPAGLPKPRVGLIRDQGIYPRWTKYILFLEANGFPYEIYNVHASDWLEKAKNFDWIVGIPSSSPQDLDEMRRKLYFLETHMNKFCYPSAEHIRLYEDKRLTAFYAEYYNFPIVKTYISHDREEALKLIETLQYPVVSKIDPSSGSMGVELIKDLKTCRRLVRQAFSPMGRKTHLLHMRQKNYIYLQDLLSYDGYDLRVILVNNMAFGYYRKTPEGEFRASGMDLVEKRSLPAEAIHIAHQLNQAIKSPQLVVDMLHGKDGQYHIIEISPICQMETAAQLEVDGEAGVYILEEDGRIHFEKGRYWVHELALRQYLQQTYLPRFHPAPIPD